MRFLLAILLLLFAAPAMAQQGQGMSKALVVSSCGGGALPSGALTQLTMNPQGQLCVGGTGIGAGCAQATAYLARAIGETAHAADLTTMICGLVTDGVWSSLDALYVLAQQTETDAKLNLIGTSYSLTQTGSLTQIGPRIGTISFTAYRGFSGFNTLGSYLDTGFNASTAVSPHFTRNSANFGVWSIATATENFPEFGNNSTGAAGESHIYNAYSGGLFYARLNDPSVGSVPAPGTAGLFVGDRPSSSSVIPYWNGAAQASQASTSAAVFNGNFLVGRVGLTGSSQQLAEAHIGASLGAAGNLALYNRLRTYMTAVGVP